MYAILALFVTHWYASVFAQTFFLHRYAAHQMFEFRNKFWERAAHLFTIVAQGPSFLNPYGYAILHRMHHAYSDTEKDPHSPHHAKNFFHMMLNTKKEYHAYSYNEKQPQKEFDQPVPSWPLIDALSKSWVYRIVSGSFFVFFYMYFVPADMPYLYALVPLHWLMGPIHGAIVNWGGHKYGYVNFKKTKDHSKNTLPFDFVTFGELFQNNHHGAGTSPNFAMRWFEIDPAYQIMKLLQLVGIIRMKKDAVRIDGVQGESKTAAAASPAPATAAAATATRKTEAEAPRELEPAGV